MNNFLHLLAQKRFKVLLQAAFFVVICFSIVFLVGVKPAKAGYPVVLDPPSSVREWPGMESTKISCYGTSNTCNTLCSKTWNLSDDSMSYTNSAWIGSGRNWDDAMSVDVLVNGTSVYREHSVFNDLGVRTLDQQSACNNCQFEFGKDCGCSGGCAGGDAGPPSYTFYTRIMGQMNSISMGVWGQQKRGGDVNAYGAARAFGVLREICYPGEKNDNGFCSPISAALIANPTSCIEPCNVNISWGSNSYGSVVIHRTKNSAVENSWYGLPVGGNFNDNGLPKGTYIYYLDGYDGAGSSIIHLAQQTVNVTTSPPVSCGITANNQTGSITIDYGTAATIDWWSKDAINCTVTPINSTDPNGSQSSGNLTSATLYTISCSGAGASSCNGTVDVNIRTTVPACTASPSTVLLPSSGPTSPIILNGSNGTNPDPSGYSWTAPGGSLSANPGNPTTVTYTTTGTKTVTVSNYGLNGTCSVIVNSPPACIPVNCSVTDFSAFPNPINTCAFSGSTTISASANAACGTYDIRKGTTSGTIVKSGSGTILPTSVSPVTNSTDFYMMVGGKTTSDCQLAKITVNLQCTPKYRCNTPSDPGACVRDDAAGTFSTNTCNNSCTAAPDFTISHSPASQSVSPGVSTYFTITATSVNNFSGNVTLSSVCPANATCSFSGGNVLTVPAGGSVTRDIWVSTNSSITAGTKTLTVTGVSGSLTHSTNPTLIVTVAAPAIRVVPTSFSFSAIQNGTASPKTLTVYNDGGSPLTWLVSDNAAWLTVRRSLPVGGETSGTESSLGHSTPPLTVSVDTTGLGAGTYSASISVTSNDPAYPTVTIPVSFVITALATRDAECVLVSAPSTLSAGQAFTATVTMKNTGLLTWESLGVNPTNPYRLGLIYPVKDNYFWGPTTARIELPVATVTTNNTVTFPINAIAPSTPGTYGFNWEMLQEGMFWFPEPDHVPSGICRQNITVTAQPVPDVNASITAVNDNTSFNISDIKDGDTLTFSVRYRNIGNLAASRINASNALSSNLEYVGSFSCSGIICSASAYDTGTKTLSFYTTTSLGVGAEFFETFKARVNMTTTQSREFISVTAAGTYDPGAVPFSTSYSLLVSPIEVIKPKFQEVSP